MIYENSGNFASQLDLEDPLSSYRDQFHIPLHNNKECIYFTGNSLGLQPKDAKRYIEQELEDWKNLGVEGHFKSEVRPWFHYHKFSKAALAALVGASPSEVVAMNNLTSNLHLMMVSFYRPSRKRNKIIIEGGAFPSDQYAVESQIRFHGFGYEQTLIELKPRPGEHNLRTEDILSTIKDTGDNLALVLLPGVQYFTGQWFDIQKITQATHEVGALAGYDLAHAIGNIPLQLHDHDVDFAVWCSYKYLNSGPGGVSGVFVHEKHGNNKDVPRFAGWWGQDEDERFKMQKGFKPMPGADGWQLSNVNVLGTVAHLASLELFDKIGMEALRSKSLLLTGFMEFLLKSIPLEKLRLLTPEDSQNRGCQLSILVNENGRQVFNELTESGVVSDWREPNLPGQGGVIRVAPVPLYNTFNDVYQFYLLLKKALDV